MNDNVRYDVVISFAGEDRKYAEALAEELSERGITVFYDAYEKGKLWGKDLYSHLIDVYKDQARYCVMLLSRHYAAKLWTNHERKAAQARAFSEREEYILPVRLDDTEVVGVLPTVAYLSWPSETAETLAAEIAEKLYEFMPEKHHAVTKSQLGQEYLESILERLEDADFKIQQHVLFSGMDFKVVATNNELSSASTFGFSVDLSFIISVKRLIEYGTLLAYAETCAEYAYAKRKRKAMATLCIPTLITSRLDSGTATSIAGMQPLAWPSLLRTCAVGGVLGIPVVYEMHAHKLHYTGKSLWLKGAVWPMLRGQIVKILQP